MKLFLLSMLMLSAFSSYPQDDQLPPLGEFSDKERLLTQCDFDKDADAIILFHVATSDYNDNGNLITSHRIRFKILKQKGIDKANIEIPYYSKNNFEDIFRLEAITYTPDDKGEISIKELDKKAVFRQKLNERVSVLKFTLPNVRVGTIVDYKYDAFAKNYGGLRDWFFQSDIPTVLSRFNLNVVTNAEFTYVVHKSHSMPVKMTTHDDGGMDYEMSNIPGLHYEPYMDAPSDYLQHVEFQYAGYYDEYGKKVNYMTTWRESVKELLEANYFGKQFEKALPNSEEVMARANTFSNPYDKMKFIYEYVKNNFAWNNINAKYARDETKDVWSDKKGTSGEINLVLINLLKKAGLQVDPMLVSDRDNGKVRTNYPLIGQFNNVVAYTTIDNRKFILDATSINTPENMIPFNILNTNAFIVNSENPQIIILTDSKSSSNLIKVNSKIDNSGTISGSTTVSSYDYAKISRLEGYRKNKEKFKHDYFEKDYGEIRIDSFEINNTETDSLPLQQQFKFTMPAAISGNYKLVNVNLFSGLEKNPFTLDNRFTDVDFGCLQRTDINETFELPLNMKPEEIPKNVQLVSPDKSINFTRKINFEGNTITLQMSLEINKALYPVDDYQMLKKFYKKIYNMLSEQFVLSSK